MVFFQFQVRILTTFSSDGAVQAATFDTHQDTRHALHATGICRGAHSCRVTASGSGSSARRSMYHGPPALPALLSL